MVAVHRGSRFLPRIHPSFSPPPSLRLFSSTPSSNSFLFPFPPPPHSSLHSSSPFSLAAPPLLLHLALTPLYISISTSSTPLQPRWGTHRTGQLPTPLHYPRVTCYWLLAILLPAILQHYWVLQRQTTHLALSRLRCVPSQSRAPFSNPPPSTVDGLRSLPLRICAFPLAPCDGCSSAETT